MVLKNLPDFRPVVEWVLDIIEYAIPISHSHITQWLARVCLDGPRQDWHVGYNKYQGYYEMNFKMKGREKKIYSPNPNKGTQRETFEADKLKSKMVNWNTNVI